MVIDAKFDGVSEFSDGYCAVLLGGSHGKWGFIDHSGSLTINPRFAMVWGNGFDHGFARVELGSDVGSANTGMINKKGDVIIPAVQDVLSDVQEGLVIGYDMGMLKGHNSPPRVYAENGKLAFAGPFVDLGHFSEGLASAAIVSGDLKSKKWGYIDRSGHWKIAPNFDYASSFKGGLAAIGVSNKLGSSDEGMQYGYVNSSGQVVIPPQFDFAMQFNNDLALVQIGDDKSGKWGFIDRSAKYVVDPIFSDLAQFSDGLAAASADGKAYGYIDHNGRFAIPPRYQAAWPFSKGYAVVGVGSDEHMRWGMIDKKGRIVVPISLEDHFEFSEGLASAKMGGKFGYISEPAPAPDTAD